MLQEFLFSWLGPGVADALVITDCALAFIGVVVGMGILVASTPSGNGLDAFDRSLARIGFLVIGVSLALALIGVFTLLVILVVVVFFLQVIARGAKTAFS